MSRPLDLVLTVIFFALFLEYEAALPRECVTVVPWVDQSPLGSSGNDTFVFRRRALTDEPSTCATSEVVLSVVRTPELDSDGRDRDEVT